MSKMTLVAAMVMAVGGAAAWADEPKVDILTPEATVPMGEKAGETEAKKPEKKNVGQDMVSPEAAMTLDQEDLLKKLLGDEKASNDPAKKFDEVVERMGSSAGRLSKKDPGEVTQETQRRIVADLDMLIEMAKKSQSQSKGKGEPQQGQKKQESKGQQKGSQPGQGQGGTSAAENSSLRDGTATATPNDKDIHEVNQETWHNLPAKDRDAIVNAPREEVLPQYRAMMDKYYEELAKPKKN